LGRTLVKGGVRRVVLALAAGLVSLCVFPGLAGAAAPGAPDRSFSGNGHVITKMGGFVNNAQWGGIDSKARIVAVGGSFYRRHGVDSSDMALVRYTRHGRLDDAFSGNGKLHFRLQPRSVFARAGAIDGHGRILAAGGLCMNPTFEKDCQFVVARFKPDGRIDRSFSGDGHVITAFPGNAVITSMAVRRGKIIVGGFAGDKIALARYERNGRLDSSFGTGGIVTKDVFPGDDYVASIALDHHGRIVVADEGAGFALARFTPGGRLDPSFGHGGTVTTDFHGYRSWSASGDASSPRGRARREPVGTGVIGLRSPDTGGAASSTTPSRTTGRRRRRSPASGTRPPR
jgi:uncharacterized delta-60 repeat protein